MRTERAAAEVEMFLLDFETGKGRLSVDVEAVSEVLPASAPRGPAREIPGYAEPLGYVDYNGGQIPLFSSAPLGDRTGNAPSAFGSCLAVFDSPGSEIGPFAVAFPKVLGVRECRERERALSFGEVLKLLKSDE